MRGIESTHDRSSRLTVLLLAIALGTPGAVSMASSGGQAAAPTVVVNAYEEGFEDDDYEGWSQIWWDVTDCPGPRSPESNDADDWLVVQDPALDGDSSLEHNSHCSSTNSGDTLATDSRVLNPSRPFELTFEFYFEDSEHRGAQTFLMNSSQDGTKDGDRVDTKHLVNFFRLHNPTSSKDKDQAVEIFGERFTIGDNDSPITNNEQHTARLVHSRTQFTAYMDGEQLASLNESEVPDDIDLNQDFRFAFSGSGNWGADSTIWYDALEIRPFSLSMVEDEAPVSYHDTIENPDYPGDQDDQHPTGADEILAGYTGFMR